METQLDLQMMSQTAENVDIWFWDANAWLYSFVVEFMNSEKVPNVLSMSWGWAEKAQCDITTCVNITSKQYVDRVNIEYAKLGLRGITIVVASGDAGAAGRTNELCDNNQINPVFPGGSPFVTSVGATFVKPNNKIQKKWKSKLCKQYGCTHGSVQLPTNFNDTQWTSGGGFSNYSLRPHWQNSQVKTYFDSGIYLPSNCSKLGRGYPDVTVVGHNCPIIMNGYLTSGDGTSCSSPIFASMITLLNDYQKGRGKPRLGFVNPLLYKMLNTFTDITMGNNYCTEYQCCSREYGYTATKGWDPVTGLGSPNLGKMIEWLNTYT